MKGKKVILTLKDFIRMEEIDHQYFPNENISPAKEAYKWYLADPNSCIFVKDNSNVVAYVNLLSLKKEIYEKVKYNKLNESEILVTDLELDKHKYYNYLYFSCIAIDKEHRNIQTLKKLIQITSQKILEIENMGYEIKEVMADCSTPQGIKITQKFLKLKPFKKTDHGSTIHIETGKEFLKNIERAKNTKF